MSVKASDHLKSALSLVSTGPYVLFEAAILGYAATRASELSLKRMFMERGTYQETEKEREEEALCKSLIEQINTIVQENLKKRGLTIPERNIYEKEHDC